MITPARPNFASNQPDKKVTTIVGGGPLAIYLLREYLQQANNHQNLTLNIVSASSRIGVGMPYDSQWVGPEHDANIVCQEVPILVTPPHIWLMKKDDEYLTAHGISRGGIGEEYLLPRIPLGDYLTAQSEELLGLLKEKGVQVQVLTDTVVTNIRDDRQADKIFIEYHSGSDETCVLETDDVIIATGHEWPKRREAFVPGYFDSPWPIHKLVGVHNVPVGIQGSYLSAVDVVKTLALKHGTFQRLASGSLEYFPNTGTDNFHITLLSRHGLLPSLRFHFEFPMIRPYMHISRDAMEAHIVKNEGYLSLDFMFDSYKSTIEEKDPEFFLKIKDMNLEQFVSYVYEMRISKDPFDFFRREIDETLQSISDQRPIYWEEVLDDWVYTINLHASSLSAEDMIRMKTVLMPLVAHIVSFLPHKSAEMLLALHEARKLDVCAVGFESLLTVNADRSGAIIQFEDPQSRQLTKLDFPVFIDCRGQREMPFQAFPFQSLVDQGAVRPALLRFRSEDAAIALLAKHQPGEPEKICAIDGAYYLLAGGVAVDQSFFAIDADGQVNPRLQIMAIPHISGCFPYQAGLAFCSDAAKIAVAASSAAFSPSCGVKPMPSIRLG